MSTVLYAAELGQRRALGKGNTNVTLRMRADQSVCPTQELARSFEPGRLAG